MVVRPLRNAVIKSFKCPVLRYLVSYRTCVVNGLLVRSPARLGLVPPSVVRYVFLH